MKHIRIHHLQHVPFEGLGMFKDWIREKNIQHTSTQLYKNEPLPAIDDFDILLVFGGPMSVHDEVDFFWLKKEKEFILKAIQSNKKVIGICLGAQLIAHVLGAKVYKNKNKEIGYFTLQKPINVAHPISNLAHQIQDLFHEKTVFHWHGETFDLPANAIHLAYTNACVNQAFLYNNNVLALQFHIEMDATSIHQIIDNCREELILSDFIQSEETITNKLKTEVEENKRILLLLMQLLLQ